MIYNAWETYFRFVESFMYLMIRKNILLILIWLLLLCITYHAILWRMHELFVHRFIWFVITEKHLLDLSNLWWVLRWKKVLYIIYYNYISNIIKNYYESQSHQYTNKLHKIISLRKNLDFHFWFSFVVILQNQNILISHVSQYMCISINFPR